MHRMRLVCILAVKASYTMQNIVWDVCGKNVAGMGKSVSGQVG